MTNKNTPAHRTAVAQRKTAQSATSAAREAVASAEADLAAAVADGAALDAEVSSADDLSAGDLAQRIGANSVRVEALTRLRDRRRQELADAEQAENEAEGAVLLADAMARVAEVQTFDLDAERERFIAAVQPAWTEHLAALYGQRDRLAELGEFIEPLQRFGFAVSEDQHGIRIEGEHAPRNVEAQPHNARHVLDELVDERAERELAERAAARAEEDAQRAEDQRMVDAIRMESLGLTPSGHNAMGSPVTGSAPAARQGERSALQDMADARG